jgi:hypothetical protein
MIVENLNLSYKKKHMNYQKSIVYLIWTFKIGPMIDLNPYCLKYFKNKY